MDILGLTAQQLDESGAHWTAREVLQQPQIWLDVEKLMAADAARRDAFLAPLLERGDLRIVLTGAGTSGFIGECLAPALATRWGARVTAVSTTDLVSSPASWLSADTPTLLVSFGRSGNSPESVAALDMVEACVKKSFHLVVTCDPSGALHRRAEASGNAYSIVLPEASNDRSFAMTSSFTGMLLAAAIALRAQPPRDGRVGELGALAQQLLPGRLPLIRSLVAREFDRVVYLGSKELKGLARESALKMLELTDGKVVAMADSPLGFRHGPKTILNDKSLVVLFVSNDGYTRQYDLDLMHELRRDAVAGRVIALSATQGVGADDIELKGGAQVVTDLELCLPYAVFAQTLALFRSLSLGVRPDNPNAAGTVSRVVKGVTIYPWRGTA
jgi:tagatose-6-phosphate ketose/aldose isomerase